MADSHPETSSEEPSSLDVTSNIRQGLPCPDPPTLHHHSNSLLSQIRTAIPADSIYSLPAPDLAPRFVLKADEPQIDETMLIQEPGGAYDIPVYPQTPSYDPSCSPPRIYFADSAITFVPPLCYDYLERDPDVKGVPRNYRAWMRTGRPRLELDGVERAEAKSDFASMGLVFPRDGESEADGDENENEKKRKRKKKQAAKALMVPIERPRRMVKKPGDTGLLTPQSLPPIAAADKDFKEVISQPEIIAVQIVKEAQKGLVLDVAEKSDGSERRSTSTLLESDSAEIPGKRKRRENDKGVNTANPAKKQRVSKRSSGKTHPQPQKMDLSPVPAPEPDPMGRAHSMLSELTPAPELPIAADILGMSNKSGRQRSSPEISDRARRKTTGESTRAAIASTSRPPPFPASRPGHRVNRSLPLSLPRSVQMRTLPASVPIISGYSGFYRRYPLITQFERDDPLGKHINQDDDSQPKRNLGNWNAPRDPRDLYTPRYTKGSGNKKIALCPICYEDTARGGEGRQEWNHTKTSQHNYHMQYYHGISATRCAPFSPPIAHRSVPVARPQSNEKSEILQGKCHSCKQWVALEGCKIGELKVKELFWWKHAASCHKDSILAQEADTFIEDDVYRRLQDYEAIHTVTVVAESG